MSSERLVILDRDGVINEDSDAYIKSASEWIPIPGSIETIARLSQSGFRVAIATNQSGIARGLFALSDLNSIHQELRNKVARLGGRIDMIAFCPHGPTDACQCRKPRPGLLIEIAERLSFDLAGVPFIGDSIGDLQAARAVGAVPWLVRTGKGEKTLIRLQHEPGCGSLEALPIYQDLSAAADALLKTKG